MSVVAQAIKQRHDFLSSVDEHSQASNSQYFTPLEAARLMVNLFDLPETGTIRVLDPGAGTGILSAALIERVQRERPHLKLHLTAIEIDPALIPALSETLDSSLLLEHEVTILNTDFLQWGLSTSEKFDFVIQNPPYKKLRAGSSTDLILKENEIYVPNLYAAFMSVGAKLLRAYGQQVSVTPRSWMNGTYYKKFRQNFLNNFSLIKVHTFESRSKVFKDTNVLQESIIIRIDKTNPPQDVGISISEDHTASSITKQVPYSLVCTGDFVFIPATDRDVQILEWIEPMNHFLSDLGINVSTGKVVDFRQREHLSIQPTDSTYPLIYSRHIDNGTVRHPLAHHPKPQWFQLLSPQDVKYLVPAGTYVVVKRFSAKEEKRRISAALYQTVGPAAFDNKTNYFHINGHGLPETIASGLCAWLNSEEVDAYFRVFSGHTQVNATDLRQMKFPSVEELEMIGNGALDVRSIGKSHENN